MLTLDEISDKLAFFEKMYDAVRLVDPVHKKVLEYRGSALADTEELCHQYWGRGRICDNCISIRAYQGNKSFVKLEKSPHNILLVTALPIEHTDKPAVLELLKNATDTMLIGSGEYAEGELFHHFIDEISESIVRDPLTNLYNRRFVDERLPVDIIDATLKGKPLSVCFIDVDDFKTINDHYGHKAGDTALRAVGSVISGSIRGRCDWAARYGGDEFLLCLGNTDEKQAHVVASRIQSKLGHMASVLPQGTARLSISYGIETMGSSPMTAGELIHGADQKMYRFKNGKTPEQREK